MYDSEAWVDWLLYDSKAWVDWLPYDNEAWVDWLLYDSKAWVDWLFMVFEMALMKFNLSGSRKFCIRCIEWYFQTQTIKWQNIFQVENENK